MRRDKAGSNGRPNASERLNARDFPSEDQVILCNLTFVKLTIGQPM
jgi:hypothetical protein